MSKELPVRWKYKGTEQGFGCYFPTTDLNVNCMGDRGTGIPSEDQVEWIDPRPTLLDWKWDRGLNMFRNAKTGQVKAQDGTPFPQAGLEPRLETDL